MAKTAGDDPPLGDDKTTVFFFAVDVAFVDRANVYVGYQGEHFVVSGLDDVPLKIAARRRVDIASVVADCLQVVDFAGDYLGAIVDVIEDDLLHELGWWRRWVGAVEDLVAGAEAHGLAVSQDVYEYVFFKLPTFYPVLEPVNQVHPAARRLDDQGVDVVRFIEVALPIDHPVYFVRMVLPRDIASVQIHRDVLCRLARQEHERPIVVVYVPGKLRRLLLCDLQPPLEHRPLCQLLPPSLARYHRRHESLEQVLQELDVCDLWLHGACLLQYF